MYIVKIYEEDFSEENGEHLLFVGTLRGKFITKKDAELVISSQSKWCIKNFIFKIVEIIE